MDSLTILAPAYNEAENIRPFVEHFYPKLEKHWRILFINDGSTDETQGNLKDVTSTYPQISYINHKKNMGLGKAFDTGFKNIKTDYVITIDCDLSHTFPVVEELYINRKKADIVIASMGHINSEYSRASSLRVIIAKLGNFIISKLLGVKVPEVAGGPRIYKTEAIKDLVIESQGFESQVEIVKKLASKGYSFDECALFLDKRLYGESKMSYIRTILGIIKILLFK